MSKKRLDLQMFADASAQLQNTTGAAGMTAEMKTYYEKTLLDLAEPALVHDQFGDSYPIPANNGKTIEFRKYDALPKATTPLTEGVTPAGQALNVTTVTAEVHQYGGWVPLTDMLDLTAIDNNIVQATNVLASQGGRTMDTIVRDILNGGTNVIYAPKIGTGGAETAVTSRADLDATAQLTVDLIDQAVALLQTQNADTIGDSFVAIVHPHTSYDIRKDPELDRGAQVCGTGGDLQRRDRQDQQRAVRGFQRGKGVEGRWLPGGAGCVQHAAYWVPTPTRPPNWKAAVCSTL